MIQFYSKYKTWIKAILLILVLAIVAQFVLKTDFSEIGGYLKKMPFTFAGIIILSFTAYFCATLAWKLCLGEHSEKTSLGRLFMMRHVGEMLSVFNPTSVVAGETLKANYLRKQNIPSDTSISSILMSRILIILSALLLMMLSVLFLISKTIGIDEASVYVVLGIFFVGVFGYLLARFLLHSQLYLHRFILLLQQKFGKKYISTDLCNSVLNINQAAYHFYHHNRKKFILAFLLSVFHWILGAAEFYLVLRVLGFDIAFFHAIAIEMGVILFKTLGAIVPGQVGVEEYANKVMLGAVGIASNEVVVVVSIMRRARQIFWVLVAFIFYVLIAKKQKRNAI